MARRFRVLPVAVREGPAPHPHPADFAGLHLVAVVVAEQDLESGNRAAERPGPHLAGPIRDEYVPHLGRAEPIEEFDAESVVPAAVQGRRQGFAGRGGQPQTAQVPGARVRMGDHVIHHGGDVDQDRGAVAGDLREQLVGGAALRKEHGRGAAARGKKRLEPVAYPK